MKPQVLALTVVLFATLLNLVSAGTDAGMQVVASYKGYEKRQFPNNPTLACVVADGWVNLASANDILRYFAGGKNDQGKIIPLGTPTMMFKMKSSNDVMYCKYVPGGYAGPKITTMNGKSKLLLISEFPSFAFYAKKAAGSTAESIKAAAAEMEAMLAAKKDFLQGTIMVEITATGAVYVGPIVDVNTTG